MIFPKGKTYQNEINTAKKIWRFDCQIETNEVSEDGVILIINNFGII